MAEGVCIPRSALYMHYLDFSEKHDTQPVNAASFGKVGSKTLQSIFFLNRRENLDVANPKNNPAQCIFLQRGLGWCWWGAAAGTSPAAPCEAAGALCLCIGHLISSQRRCAFVCSHNPEKFLSLAALSLFPALWTAAPQPPTQAHTAPTTPHPSAAPVGRY